MQIENGETFESFTWIAPAASAGAFFLMGGVGVSLPHASARRNKKLLRPLVPGKKFSVDAGRFNDRVVESAE